MSDLSWPEVLSPLIAGESLSEQQSFWAMTSIMQGEATPAQFGAFVASLRAKGETVEEIRGLVSAMRAMSSKVEVQGPLVDTCGTGGDRSGTINVSTIAALVVAGAGARVAKHGNRAASSACGSADLLEALGVRIDLGPEGVAACIEQVGMGFCFAQVFHPSMRHAAGPRKEMGVATIFNFLGPLTNPAGATRQALGVSDPSMAPKMVEVLRDLGSERVVAFHGSDGLDEITTTGTTTVWDLEGGEIERYEIEPSEFGIKPSVPGDLRGGTAGENAAVTRAVLGGEEGPARDIVALNAAAGLIAAGLAAGMAEGVEMAAASIDSRSAGKVLLGLVEVSNRE